MGKWFKLAEMGYRRDELSTCVGPCGSVYAMGGYGLPNIEQGTVVDEPQMELKCLKSAERFDFALEKWIELTPMHEARRALALVTMPDGIYAIGGYDG